MVNYSIFMKIPIIIDPVGKNIHNILDNKLMRVQKAMEDELSSITLKDVIEDTRFYVQQEMK